MSKCTESTLAELLLSKPGPLGAQTPLSLLALKVKGQGQLSPKSTHLKGSTQHVFILPKVYHLLHGETPLKATPASPVWLAQR